MNKIWIVIAGLFVIFNLSCGGGDSAAKNEEIRKKESIDKPKTYTVENIDGTTFVHNSSTIWRDTQPVRLELVRQVGRLEGDDENLTFYKPTDIALDTEGNLYVLDSGNHRVQKLTHDGTFLASFGKEGQGPGEFQFMDGIVLDGNGNVYITDKGTNTVKVLSPDGDEIEVLHPGGRPEKIELMRTGEMVFVKSTQESDALLLVIDPAGEVVHEYGQHEEYEDFDPYRFFNRIAFATDSNDNIFIAYATRNKVEKYSPFGEKILSIDRPLNYKISQEITYEEKQFGQRKIQIPFVNFVSASVAVDSKERIWVLSYNRQLKYEEMALSIVFRDGDGQFEGTQSLASSDEAEVDAFAFHLFNEEGHFLGEIPLTHHAGTVKISKDRIYILEPRHRMCVYIYNILEKD